MGRRKKPEVPGLELFLHSDGHINFDTGYDERHPEIRAVAYLDARQTPQEAAANLRRLADIIDKNGNRLLTTDENAYCSFGTLPDDGILPFDLRVATDENGEPLMLRMVFAPLSDSPRFHPPQLAADAISAYPDLPVFRHHFIDDEERAKKRIAKNLPFLTTQKMIDRLFSTAAIA